MKNVFMILVLFTVMVIAQQNEARTNITKYRLVISFGSECCGVDREAVEEIDKIISDYETEKKIKLQMKKVYWGKEGEFDYCYMLTEISKSEQTKLIAKIKAIAERATQVSVRENSFNSTRT